MLAFLEKTKQYLWLFVEIAFATVLAVVLIHLIIGPDSGVFVSTVADNVLKFAGGIPPQSMVGLAIVLALVFLIANRFKPRDRA
jgi:nitrate reductase gamma subunit